MNLDQLWDILVTYFHFERIELTEPTQQDHDNELPFVLLLSPIVLVRAMVLKLLLRSYQPEGHLLPVKKSGGYSQAYAMGRTISTNRAILILIHGREPVIAEVLRSRLSPAAETLDACICQNERVDVPMVQCGFCNTWYHYKCAHVTQKLIDKLGDNEFKCFRCHKSIHAHKKTIFTCSHLCQIYGCYNPKHIRFEPVYLNDERQKCSAVGHCLGHRDSDDVCIFTPATDEDYKELKAIFLANRFLNH